MIEHLEGRVPTVAAGSMIAACRETRTEPRGDLFRLFLWTAMGKWACAAVFLGFLTGPIMAGPRPEADLDAFMRKVLQRREINWEKLRDFVFREEEALELRGFGIAPSESFRREYDWYYRDGKLVRRLVRSDGVNVSGPETTWSGEKRKRETPLARENFFGFKFEPGDFLIAGYERERGRRLMVVEYYPRAVRKDPEEPGSAEEIIEREIEAAFEKTSLVRLWILPEEHQIRKMTFENVGLEFLPYRWLVRIDGIHATLVMDQSVGEVWLPRIVLAEGRVSTAAASLNVKYERRFFDYREADVEVRLQFEEPAPEGDPTPTP